MIKTVKLNKDTVVVLEEGVVELLESYFEAKKIVEDNESRKTELDDPNSPMNKFKTKQIGGVVPLRWYDECKKFVDSFKKLKITVNGSTIFVADYMNGKTMKNLSSDVDFLVALGTAISANSAIKNKQLAKLILKPSTLTAVNSDMTDTYFLYKELANLTGKISYAENDYEIANAAAYLAYVKSDHSMSVSSTPEQLQALSEIKTKVLNFYAETDTTKKTSIKEEIESILSNVTTEDKKEIDLALDSEKIIGDGNGFYFINGINDVDLKESLLVLFDASGVFQSLSALPAPPSLDSLTISEKSEADKLRKIIADYIFSGFNEAKRENVIQSIKNYEDHIQKGNKFVDFESEELRNKMLEFMSKPGDAENVAGKQAQFTEAINNLSASFVKEFLSGVLSNFVSFYNAKAIVSAGTLTPPTNKKQETDSKILGQLITEFGLIRSRKKDKNKIRECVEKINNFANSVSAEGNNFYTDAEKKEIIELAKRMENFQKKNRTRKIIIGLVAGSLGFAISAGAGYFLGNRLAKGEVSEQKEGEMHNENLGYSQAEIMNAIYQAELKSLPNGIELSKILEGVFDNNYTISEDESDAILNAIENAKKLKLKEAGGDENKIAEVTENFDSMSAFLENRIEIQNKTYNNEVLLDQYLAIDDEFNFALNGNEEKPGDGIIDVAEKETIQGLINGLPEGNSLRKSYQSYLREEVVKGILKGATTRGEDGKILETTLTLSDVSSTLKTYGYTEVSEAVDYLFGKIEVKPENYEGLVESMTTLAGFFGDAFDDKSNGNTVVEAYTTRLNTIAESFGIKLTNEDESPKTVSEIQTELIGTKGENGEYSGGAIQTYQQIYDIVNIWYGGLADGKGEMSSELKIQLNVLAINTNEDYVVAFKRIATSLGFEETEYIIDEKLDQEMVTTIETAAKNYHDLCAEVVSLYEDFGYTEDEIAQVVADINDGKSGMIATLNGKIDDLAKIVDADITREDAKFKEGEEFSIDKYVSWIGENIKTFKTAYTTVEEIINIDTDKKLQTDGSLDSTKLNELLDNCSNLDKMNEILLGYIDGVADAIGINSAEKETNGEYFDEGKFSTEKYVDAIKSAAKNYYDLSSAIEGIYTGFGYSESEIEAVVGDLKSVEDLNAHLDNLAKVVDSDITREDAKFKDGEDFSLEKYTTWIEENISNYKIVHDAVISVYTEFGYTKAEIEELTAQLKLQDYGTVLANVVAVIDSNLPEGQKVGKMQEGESLSDYQTRVEDGVKAIVELKDAEKTEIQNKLNEANANLTDEKNRADTAETNLKTANETIESLKKTLNDLGTEVAAIHSAHVQDGTEYTNDDYASISTYLTDISGKLTNLKKEIEELKNSGNLTEEQKALVAKYEDILEIGKALDFEGKTPAEIIEELYAYLGLESGSGESEMEGNTNDQPNK